MRGDLIRFYLMERSVVLIKPDGVQRGLVGEIITRLERKGLQLVAMKMVSLEDAFLDVWYSHHKDKAFFPGLKKYMKAYPTIAMLWEGVDAASTIRIMLGVTKARQAEPGSIRGDLAMSTQYNLVHASENAEIAEKEANLMFAEDQVFPWKKIDLELIYASDEMK